MSSPYQTWFNIAEYNFDDVVPELAKLVRENNREHPEAAMRIMEFLAFVVEFVNRYDEYAQRIIPLVKAMENGDAERVKAEFKLFEEWAESEDDDAE